LHAIFVKSTSDVRDVGRYTKLFVPWQRSAALLGPARPNGCRSNSPGSIRRQIQW